MKFTPRHMRSIPEDFPDKFSRMPTSPFILIKKNGDIHYGGEHKEFIIEDYDEKAGDILLFSWSGRWRTDVFIVTQKDIEKHYK